MVRAAVISKSDGMNDDIQRQPLYNSQTHDHLLRRNNNPSITAIITACKIMARVGFLKKISAVTGSYLE
jgi:hypothetical protein